MRRSMSTADVSSARAVTARSAASSAIGARSHIRDAGTFQLALRGLDQPTPIRSREYDWRAPIIGSSLPSIASPASRTTRSINAVGDRYDRRAGSASSDV